MSSESITVELGNALPLSLTIPDGQSGLFPRAIIYDSVDAVVAGGPWDLTEVGTTGRYTLAGPTPVAIGSFTAHYVVYTDAGHTTESTTYLRTQDSFKVENQIASAYEGSVWLDQKRGVAGTVVGVNGTKNNPVDTLADAATLLATAKLIGLRHLRIRQTTGGALDLSTAGVWDQFIVEAIGAEVSIDFGGEDVDGSQFIGCALTGTMVGSIVAGNCDLDGVVDLDGHFNVCHLAGTNALANAARVIFDRCTSKVAGGAGQAIVDMGAAHAAGSHAQFRGWIGGIDLRNMDNAGDLVSLDFVSGHAVLGSTVSAGNLVLRGVGKKTIGAIGAVTFNDDGFVQGSILEDDLDDIQTRLPTALVGGRMDSDVAVIQAGAITSAAIATDAIDADALAADAVAEIQAGLATAASVALLETEASAASRASANQTEHDATQAAIAALPAAPSAGAVADAVWDEALSGHAVVGSAGAAHTETLSRLGRHKVVAVLTKVASGPGAGLPLTQRVRYYDSAANATLDDGVTGLLAEDTVTATDTGSSMDTFEQLA